MNLHIRTTTLRPHQTPTPHQISKTTQTEVFLPLLKNWRSTAEESSSPTPSKNAQTEVYHQLHRQEHRSKGQLLHQRTPRHQNLFKKDQERQEMRQTLSQRHLS